MSRTIPTATGTEVDGDHIHMVYMVAIAFDTPIYAHSGFGTITYDSNDYLGVGDFGAVSGVEEGEDFAPTPIRLELSGVDSTLIGHAKDSTQYDALVTLYMGFRNDSGALIADPSIIYKGFVDNADILIGSDNVISLTVQHALKTLGRKGGERYSDAHQQSAYATDVAFEFIAGMADLRLTWGAPSGSGATFGSGFAQPRRDLYGYGWATDDDDYADIGR